MSETLDVLDFTGTARSGKGTITKHLYNLDPERSLRFETGIEYRRATYELVNAGVISADMSDIEISQKICEIEEFDTIASSEDPEDEKLYSDILTSLVSKVASSQNIRAYVKCRFIERVEIARDNPEIKTVITDGRNLASLLVGIPEVKLLISTFVTCSPTEMKLRECARLGINSDSIEAKVLMERLQRSNKEDASRPIDPVKPNVDAIDYWHFTDFDEPTLSDIDRIGAEYAKTAEEAKRLFPAIRLGAGSCAVATGRQLYFDTTPFAYAPDSVAAMNISAKLMYLETKAS